MTKHRSTLFRRRRPKDTSTAAVNERDDYADINHYSTVSEQGQKHIMATSNFGDADLPTHIDSPGNSEHEDESTPNATTEDRDHHDVIIPSSSSSSDPRDDISHTTSNSETSPALTAAEHDRLHGLVAYHTARANRVEAENTTLKVELANVRFDLEHTRLELRQMTMKRDEIRTELQGAMMSKATMAQTLGGENTEMLTTIDKLETERDILREEVDRLKTWIVKNEGEGDVINEEGAWTGCTDLRRDVADIGPTLTKEEIDAWEATLIPEFSKGSIAATVPNDDATYLTADTTAASEDSEDKLYPDEYVNSVDEDDSDEDDDDYESFGKIYHRTASDKKETESPKAGQNTGQDEESSVDTADTNSTSEKKKKKKRIFGVSVRPRKTAFAQDEPESPTCVSHT